MKILQRLTLTCVTAGLWAGMSPCVLAQDADTIEKIRKSGVITLGNREVSRPFSFLDANKQPVGYAMDLCLKAVEQIRRDYQLPNLKVRYLTVSAAERIPKLLDGSIDLECGSTTNTQARQEKIDFSLTYFVAGMKLLTRNDSGIRQYTDLKGKRVGVTKGTTSDKLFNQLKAHELQGVQIVSFANNVETLKALEAGQVDAYPQDDILLAGLMSSLKDRKAYSIVGDYLSVEPYGVGVRRGDVRLKASVDKALVGLYHSGEIFGVYQRWFDTDTLKIPMSRLLRDSITNPASSAGVALLLGYSI